MNPSVVREISSTETVSEYSLTYYTPDGQLVQNTCKVVTNGVPEMKNFMPNLCGSEDNPQQLQPQQEHPESSSDETEEEIENPEEQANAQSEVVLDTDYILFSISSWIYKFRDLMPDTCLINLPDGISGLFLADVNILEITDSEPLNEFCRLLDMAIARVGGTAFIKNNWHAPRDAAMFSLNHLLKVNNARDALSYIMYSDIMMKDFDKQLGLMPFCVSVRPWMDIHPATEFRCIVVHKAVVGLTPREWPKYYGHFKDIMPFLIETVTMMCVARMRDFPAENFVFDVIYLNPHSCFLWDISPLNESTRLYAFMWNEIKDMIEAPPQPRPPVFRYLAEDIGILPSNLAYQQQY